MERFLYCVTRLTKRHGKILFIPTSVLIAGFFIFLLNSMYAYTKPENLQSRKLLEHNRRHDMILQQYIRGATNRKHPATEPSKVVSLVIDEDNVPRDKGDNSNGASQKRTSIGGKDSESLNINIVENNHDVTNGKVLEGVNKGDGPNDDTVRGDETPERAEPIQSGKDDNPLRKDTNAGESNVLQTKDSQKVYVGQKLQSGHKKADHTETPVPGHCYKQVHMWTNAFQWAPKDRKYRLCPGLRCGFHAVENTSFETMQSSDVVILFHETHWNWQDMLRNKPQGQKWVFSTHESPVNTRRGIVPPKEFSNITYDYIMNYRRHPGSLFGDYGRYVPGKPSVPNDAPRNWAKGKNKLVAWVAKNCYTEYLHWNRTGFVRSLAQLVSVDMYGGCGDQECPRYSRNCTLTMKEHKFYLALENCNCRNYITEKVWRQSFGHELVPIVYGPPKEDYELVLPPHSFIHIQDFESLQNLADYITFLDSNDDRYNEYFEWKKTGSVELCEEKDLFTLGSLCDVLMPRLMADEEAEAEGRFQPMEPPDWDSWWRGSCRKDGEFPIRMN